jgi:ketosteroid isomerase-like protein
MTPEARAILADPDLPLATGACLERFFRWGAAPTVDAYCDLFAADGTLLDADMEAPIRGATIRESITRVLQLLPDFRFRPVRVVHAGPHAFVLAANRASLGDRALVWNAIYALTLAGERIRAGRRYYDQAALLTGTDTFARAPHAGPDDGDDGPDTPPTPDGLARDLAARTAAWNRRDLASLAAPLGRVRLHLAGVARPLERAADVRTALAAVAARVDRLAVEPGAVVRSDRGTAVEWVGTIGSGAGRRRFALVELCAPLPEVCEWHLVFNTLGL